MGRTMKPGPETGCVRGSHDMASAHFSTKIPSDGGGIVSVIEKRGRCRLYWIDVVYLFISFG
jgi:hypothetical protein